MKIKRFLLVLLVILINGLTFVEALMPSKQSTSQSESVLGAINEIIQGVSKNDFTYQNIESISIKGTKTIHIGEVEVFSYDVSPKSSSFPSLIWESSNEEVALVSQFGRVSGVGVGEAIIKLSSEENKEIFDTFKIEVLKKEKVEITSIELLNVPKELKSRVSYPIDISINPVEGSSKLKYGTSDNSIASFENGVIRTYRSGFVTLSVTSEDDERVCKEFSLQVLDVEGIKPSAISLDVDDVYYINRTAMPSIHLGNDIDDDNLLFKIEDESIARYEDGIVGIKEGETSIKACRLFDEEVCSSSYHLRVSDVKLEKLEIVINGQESDLIVGKRLQLKPKFTPSDVTYKDVTWSINGDGAKIGHNGLIVGLKTETVEVSLLHNDSQLVARKSFNVKKASTLTKHEKEVLHNMIRKVVGHFGLFALNGFLSCAMFISFFLKSKKVIIFTVGSGLIFSIVAELLQLIPVGRACQISDMVINFFGFFVGMLLFLGLLKISLLVRRKRLKKENFKE